MQNHLHERGDKKNLFRPFFFRDRKASRVAWEIRASLHIVFSVKVPEDP